MSIPVAIGNPVPIELNLESEPDTSKYAIAIITDTTGAEVPESPITLGAITSRKFIPSVPYLMPDKNYITVVYELFNDALLTIPTSDYYFTEERFYASSVIESGSGSGSTNISGLTGILETIKLKGNLEPIPEPFSGLKAIIKLNNLIDATLGITGSINLSVTARNLKGVIKYD